MGAPGDLSESYNQILICRNLTKVFPSKAAMKSKRGTSPLDSSNIPSEPERESLFQFNLLANPDAES